MRFARFTACAALAAGAVLLSATPAAAVNGADCTDDAIWYGGYSGSEATLTTPGAELDSGLTAWRDLITCSWTLPDWYYSNSTPGHSVAFRGFPGDEVPAVFRALAASGWKFDTIYSYDSTAIDDATIPVEDFDTLSSTLSYLTASAYLNVNSDGGGSYGDWMWVTYDAGGWYGGNNWDEPTLFVEWWTDGAGSAATGIADPSTFSTLRTVSDVVPTPAQTGVIAGSAVFLMLIVGWPGYLLNSVIAARYTDARDWVRTRTSRPRARIGEGIARARSWLRTPAPAPPATAGTDASAFPTSPAPVRGANEPASPRTAPTWVVWPGLAIAAFISCFVDPSFGLNWMSLRLLLSSLVAFVAFNFGVLALTRLVVRRIQPDSLPRLEFRWTSLALVLAAVVLARLLGFHPGIVFGLVAGLAFAASLTRARSAIVTLLGAGFGLAAGIVAWLGYSLIAPAAAGVPALLVVSETLAGITLEGISALPIALLPLAALEGQKLFAWNRWAWAGAYTVGLAAFMLVLITVPGSFGEIQGDFVRWFVLFLSFGVAAVGVWWLNGWIERRKGTESAVPGSLVRQPETGTATPSPGLG